MATRQNGGDNGEQCASNAPWRKIFLLLHTDAKTVAQQAGKEQGGN
ncbi:hypothetical protein SEEN2570_22914 [Salmonella enterica subsp. enterica serovar Newport str. VA_R100512570]|nr:hypothetical protein SEEN2570_22914 [Salmonella enterica subsp. enterica serovar Newport str. VA_R100512570]